MTQSETLDVLIIGAGPAGLAAAIAASKARLSYQVIEKGALVNSLLHYPTEMVFFTTPELMEIGGLPFVSPNDKPSRAALSTASTTAGWACPAIRGPQEST